MTAAFKKAIQSCVILILFYKDLFDYLYIQISAGALTGLPSEEYLTESKYNEVLTQHFFFSLLLKGARSYFSKSNFLFHLKNHHSKVINSKFELKWVSRLDGRINFVICICLYLLCKLNHGYHNQAHFH